MRISYFPDPPPRLGGGARTRASSTYRSCSAGYVSLHTSAATSIGLVTEAVLSRANGISLINTTSVAAVVDPEALLLALEQGWVAQAAIEETYPEPSGSVRSADDRVLRLPPYTAWDTEQPREVGWMVYLESRPAPEPRDRGQGADFR